MKCRGLSDLFSLSSLFGLFRLSGRQDRQDRHDRPKRLRRYTTLLRDKPLPYRSLPKESGVLTPSTLALPSPLKGARKECPHERPRRTKKRLHESLLESLADAPSTDRSCSCPLRRFEPNAQTNGYRLVSPGIGRQEKNMRARSFGASRLFPEQLLDLFP